MIREVRLGAVQGFRDAEVREHHAARRGDENVARLDVAVDETIFVRGIESAGNRETNVNRERRTELRLLIEHFTQRETLDVFHDDGLSSTIVDDVEHSDDVRIVQCGGRLRFSSETFAHDRVVVVLRLHHLHCNFAVE